ncbi:oligosaccharide flippase family protein [Cronobacter malonaticus]|uniref:oligosaccharide flippase family protein n=2 Tax=Cronobacter malonaticus TaxID=413503 RepID=UPI0024AEB12A|nr:oligosaccharide flippase family protein [Cronobacter malonaticus]MDI7690507.1 oligosaccharide flippase family protein [Cronobacter malonaticus]MDK1297631.1 oligosaccharide flippase family protein [Cronobacter malonaticus]
MLTKTQNNFLWMITEKSIGVVGLFFINALVAKYLGPAVIGQMAIATAIFQIVQVAGVFGSDSIFYKRISTNLKSGIELMMPVFLLRSVIFIFLASACMMFLNAKMDLTGMILALSICLAYYFYTIDTYTSFNESLLNSRINALANVTGLIAGLVTRALMVKYKAPIILFGLPLVIISAIPYFLKLYLFRKQYENKRAMKHKALRKRFFHLSCAGSILVIPSVIASIYPRLNIMVISFLYGNHDVGIYSVSQTLATSWSFILLSLLTSCLLSIFQEKNYPKIINLGARLHLNIILLAIPVMLLMTPLINFLIFYIYGGSYKGSITPCILLCFATVLSTLGMASSKIIIKLSGYRFLLYKTIFILFLSLVLSYLFSLRYGLIGAASAVIITEVCSLTVINYLFMQGFILSVHIEMLKMIYERIRNFSGVVRLDKSN